MVRACDFKLYYEGDARDYLCTGLKASEQHLDHFQFQKNQLF